MNFSSHTLLVALLSSLIFTSCAKEKLGADSGATPKPNLALSGDFVSTARLGNSQLGAFASLALTRNQTISVRDVENCLNEERTHPERSDLCLLVFARGTQSSRAASEAMRGRAQVSFAAAVALAWQAKEAATLSEGEFLQVLSVLKPAPARLRMKIANAWVSASTSGTTLEKLKSLLAEGDDPQSYRAYFSFWQKYDQAYYKQEIGRYCDPRALGPARWRCWRLVGYLENPEPGFLDRNDIGNRNDDNWHHFRRQYEELSDRLQKFFQ